jgi:hypothetical protein
VQRWLPMQGLFVGEVIIPPRLPGRTVCEADRRGLAFFQNNNLSASFPRKQETNFATF